MDSRTAGAAACNAGSAGIADMSTMGAGIRNGCIGRFGNTRAEQVSPPRRTVARQHALSPGVVGLDRVAFVLGIVASVLWCIERSIRRAIIPEGTAAWSDEETRICRMRFENR